MTRSNLVLCGVLALLALIWTFGGSPAEDVFTPLNNAPLLSGFSPQDVSSIRIDVSEKSVRMKRIGQFWILDNGLHQPANKVYVSLLLETLFAATEGDLITSDPAQHGRYSLDDKALQIELADIQGKRLCHLRVGRGGKGFRSAYIRLNDSNEVQFVASALIPVLYRNTWAEKIVWQLPISVITHVNSEGIGPPLFATPEPDGHWKNRTPGFRLSPRFSGETLPLFHLIRAEQVLDPEQSLSVREQWQPTGHIEVGTQSGPLRLELYLPNEETVYAKRPQEAIVYVLDRDIVDRLKVALVPE